MLIQNRTAASEKFNLYFKINFYNFAVAIKDRGVAQLVSALRSGRRGRAFESPHPDSQEEGCVKMKNFAHPFNFLYHFAAPQDFELR